MNQNRYDPSQIEAKWAKIWEEKRIYRVDVKSAKKPFGKAQGKPFYNLAMFPYPSGEGLHVGHIVPYSGVDTFGRYKKMKGFDVFEPMGFDSFGIHSENYAIKQGKHPSELTNETIKYFRDKQMKRLGTLFDWSRQVVTSDPDYYKWTQWIFVQMFKHGLAEKKTSLVTYCPSCKTVLSDEQTETKDGVVVCERCKTPIERRKMKQWFFKITKYADRLLSNLSKINWSERTKLVQKNWIGKSSGVLIKFPVDYSSSERSESRSHINKENSSRLRSNNISIEVFTTRPDTLFGVTFMVVAPEHEFVQLIIHRHAELVSASKIPKQVRDDMKKFEMINYDELKKYVEKASTKTEQERISAGKDKTGVFTGCHAINPVNQEKIPIWVADYVVMGYGTGAIMAVPAHDQRDYDFAKKYELPIKEVIAGGDIIKEAYHGEGELVNSNDWNGWDTPRDIDKIIKWLEEKKIGERKTTYKLRDWCISRQRYWGPPIPMVYCSDCMRNGITYFDLVKKEGKKSSFWGAKRLQNQVTDSGQARMTIRKDDFLSTPGWFPVAEEELPVLLPEVKDYLPDGSGKSPLARIPSFYKTTCPYCGGEADRETDVSDTFLDSSWYFLRYPSVGVDGEEAGPAGGFPSTSLRAGLPASAREKALRAVGSLSTPVTRLLPWDSEITKKWLPVDMYIGGQEHAVLHLMYSRFVTMALFDMGYIHFEEPFTRFFAHGLMVKEGAKMSKSRGNVVDPVLYLDRYGSDCLRMYVLFMGPYDQKMDFRDRGIDGMYRFLGRVWVWVQRENQKSKIKNQKSGTVAEATEIYKELISKLHKTIKGVGEDIEGLRFNTAIAKLMEFLNEASRVEGKVEIETVKTYLKLLAPFAPFISEELWLQINGKQTGKNWSIHQQTWPEYDEKHLQEGTVTVVAQINGKVRDSMVIPFEKTLKQEEIEKLFKESEKVQKYLEGKKVIKTIFIPGKVVNFVVES